MTLEPQTLEEAERARDRLLELQHSAELARVDYHHSIRRLHAAGGSLREIAEALGLSHQRVHQIVEPVDGSAGGPAKTEHALRLRRRLRALPAFERFTADARDRVGAAIEEAADLGHRRVGTEHLLLSLAGDPSGPAGSALASLGITRESLAEIVVERLGAAVAGPAGRRPFTPAARRVLNRSLREAAGLGDRGVGGAHILLAIAADGGDAAEILARLGAPPERVRDAVLAALGS